jgi:hypothetical protein
MSRGREIGQDRSLPHWPPARRPAPWTRRPLQPIRRDVGSDRRVAEVFAIDKAATIASRNARDPPPESADTVMIEPGAGRAPPPAMSRADRTVGDDHLGSAVSRNDALFDLAERRCAIEQSRPTAATRRACCARSTPSARSILCIAEPGGVHKRRSDAGGPSTRSVSKIARRRAMSG